MKIRWKFKEEGRWTRWVDIDKTRKFLPEDAYTFEISESLVKEDAMMFFPGMFKSLRSDFKKHQKARVEISKQSNFKTGDEIKA